MDSKERTKHFVSSVIQLMDNYLKDNKKRGLDATATHKIIEEEEEPPGTRLKFKSLDESNAVTTPSETEPTDTSSGLSKCSSSNVSLATSINSDFRLNRKRNIKNSFEADARKSYPAKLPKLDNVSLNSSKKYQDSSSRPPTMRYPWDALEHSSTSNNTNSNNFRSASHQLDINNAKKFGNNRHEQLSPNMYSNSKRSLGTRKPISCKFTPPVRRDDDDNTSTDGPNSTDEESPYAQLMLDERMKNIDIKMVELIMNEILDTGPNVTWDDIAGLELAKRTIQEIVVFPMLRPDIFTGIRSPPKGLLLFGPPGTGKTMIGKCISSQSQSTFFSISASSLTSKWIGDGEKMVRALFAVARCHQPAVIFIDEIDSLLMQRSDTEHESSRRLKTEFLVQLDGAATGDDDRILVVGATNRPQELDEAARRRLVKRLYIPLPNADARQSIIKNLLTNQNHNLTPDDSHEISVMAHGYSGADVANLCREAALGPIRSLKFEEIKHISSDKVRSISLEDFKNALNVIRASVSEDDLDLYKKWNLKYGMSG